MLIFSFISSLGLFSMKSLRSAVDSSVSLMVLKPPVSANIASNPQLPLLSDEFHWLGLT